MADGMTDDTNITPLHTASKVAADLKAKGYIHFIPFYSYNPRTETNGWAFRNEAFDQYHEYRQFAGTAI